MRSFQYVDMVGTVVRVSVPWDEGSGLIPPPLIHFGDRAFRYAGVVDDDHTEADDLPRPGHGGVQP